MSSWKGRRADVIGGGLAGMLTATALAQRGWRVRLYERSPELRVFGAGIWMWGNGLSALKGVGALDRMLESGVQRLRGWHITDSRGRTIRYRTATPDDPILVPTRENLYNALKWAAANAGVEMFTDTAAASYQGDGRTLLTNGEESGADLVVGADGINSVMRDSVGLAAGKIIRHPVMAFRLLLPRVSGEVHDSIEERWSHGRTLMYCPSGPDLVYAGLVAPLHDEIAWQPVIDLASWQQAFPQSGELVERIKLQHESVEPGRWDQVLSVEARAWCEGSLALVGDSAHAMPPTLGQAANIAFMNGYSLAEFVTDSADIPSALKHWEQICRPLTLHTQRWSRIYNRISHLIPAELEPLKTPFVRAVLATSYVKRQLDKPPAARPVGQAMEFGLSGYRTEGEHTRRPEPRDQRARAEELEEAAFE